MIGQKLAPKPSTSSPNFRVAFGVVVSFVWACDQGPCLDLEKGDRLGIAITSPTQQCADELDLQEGSRVVATLREPADNAHTDCQYWQADFGRVGRWTWTFRTTVDFQGDLGGSYDLVRDDGCTGSARAIVTTPMPPASGSFEVRFEGDSVPPTCPASCVADLDAEVDKL